MFSKEVQKKSDKDPNITLISCIEREWDDILAIDIILYVLRIQFNACIISCKFLNVKLQPIGNNIREDFFKVLMVYFHRSFCFFCNLRTRKYQMFKDKSTILMIIAKTYIYLHLKIVITTLLIAMKMIPMTMIVNIMVERNACFYLNCIINFEMC